jgi:SAM-dependent methyltransferase
MNKVTHLPYTFDSSTDKGAEGEQRWKTVTVNVCKELFASTRCRILDFGCGRGELLSMLAKAGFDVVGVDIDPKCVKLSSQYAPCHLSELGTLSKLYPEGSFDVVIGLHVLEHLENPKAYVQILNGLSKRYLIFGVPNLGAMTNIQFFRTQLINEGHLHGWDFNHFKNFMEVHCGLRLVKWQPDFVVAPKISNLLHKIGFRQLIEERLLPKIIPYQSNSIIGLFEKIA